MIQVAQPRDLIERESRHQRRVSFLLTPADVHIEIGD
jgi:hypothetical protein